MGVLGRVHKFLVDILTSKPRIFFDLKIIFVSSTPVKANDKPKKYHTANRDGSLNTYY